MSAVEAEEEREQEIAAYSLQQRIDRNQQIQDTAAMPGWALICDVIKEKISAAQNRLAFGKCTSMEDYRATAAECEALIWAMNVPALVQANLSALRTQAAQDQDDDA
jgi:hypothetical protein